MSAWSSAPERGLDRVVQEVDAPVSPFAEPPTFAPDLMSDPSLRQKVNSSGYGKSPIPAKVKTERVGGLSVDEPVPEFKPELMSDPELRGKANSSAYGKVVPAKKTVEPEVPSFTPELVTKSKAVSQVWSEKANSSAYGKGVVMSRPTTAPVTPSFKPELPADKLRETVASSQYGKSPAKVERPQSANASTHSNGFDNNPAMQVTYVSRYTLLKDKPEGDKEPRAASPTFVLDGVHVAALRNCGVRNGETDLGVRKLPNYDLSRQVKEKVASSNYGVASPPTIARPEPPAESPRFKFDASVSPLAQPLEPGPTKTALADKVASHGYGVKSPYKAPKPEPKPQGPTWSPTLKAAIATELPPVPKSEKNNSVASHNYGKASPAKAERVDKPFEPVWVPSAAGHKLAKDLPPAPRSKLNDSVASHYGKDYRPPTAGGSKAQSQSQSPAVNGYHRSNSNNTSSRHNGNTSNGNGHAEEDGEEGHDDHQDEEEQHEENGDHAGQETF